jgi:hypothetical protein
MTNIKLEVEWIPVKNISVVWAGAQRPYNDNWAKQIAKEFDPDQFDPVHVTLPNGNGIYHAVDGQHRRSAVEKLWGPNERIPCIVLNAHKPHEAARLFLEKSTNRKPLKVIERFRVRVTAQDARAVDIDRIARKYGYVIENGSSPKNLMCVAALEWAYSRFGAGKVLETTLQVLQATFGRDPHAVAGPLVRGYAAFLAEHRHVNQERLKHTVHKRFEAPGRLLAAAKAHSEAMRVNGTEAVNQLLFGIYNKGCRKEQQLKRK